MDHVNPRSELYIVLEPCFLTLCDGFGGESNKSFYSRIIACNAVEAKDSICI